MTARSNAYRDRHAPHAALTPVAPQYHQHADERSGDPRADVEKLARTVHLPVAVVRGALSSFSEHDHAPNAIRICTGTSCMLAGGDRIHRAASSTHACEGVYCLGYCDRSPTGMTTDGHVVCDLAPDRLGALLGTQPAAHPAPPSIRCDARHAIITSRLLQRGAAAAQSPDYAGLKAARALTPEQVIERITEAGVKGRGGAAFPTGRKLASAAKAAGKVKFIVANGDEGDPGSFIDRELMERDPHGILEGMAIAAHAVGASRGIVYIRHEYPVSLEVMTEAIQAAIAAGHLGKDALGSGRDFSVEVVRGMGSYVCGEETALLNAIEGNRGEVRPRPPYPVEAGLFGMPTVVDNVETLLILPWLMVHGASAFAEMGTPESRGTKAICFNRGFARPGIVEIEFGMTLRDLIQRHGGGGADGAELEAVLIGGPMGSIVTPDQWDAPVCFAGLARRGINLGHAGLVAIPKPADWKAILRHLLVFMRDESCGKCVPCRLGSMRAYEMAKHGLTPTDLESFEGIMSLMKDASLCAFGRETPGPVRTILTRFADSVVMEGRP